MLTCYKPRPPVKLPHLQRALDVIWIVQSLKWPQVWEQQCWRNSITCAGLVRCAGVFPLWTWNHWSDLLPWWCEAQSNVGRCCKSGDSHPHSLFQVRISCSSSQFFWVSFPYMQFPPRPECPCHRWHHDRNLYILKSLCPITPLKVPLLRNTMRCLRYRGNTLSPGRAGVGLVDSTIWWETGSQALSQFFT